MISNRGGGAVVVQQLGGSVTVVSPSKKKKTHPNIVSTDVDVDVGVDVVDSDSQHVKYLKRRSIRNSPQHVLGLLVLMALVLVVWHYLAAVLERKTAASHRTTRLRAELLLAQQGRLLEETFERERIISDNKQRIHQVLTDWLEQLDQEIRENINGGIRWIRPYLLPAMDEDDDAKNAGGGKLKRRIAQDHPDRRDFFKVRRRQGVVGTQQKMKWEYEWDDLLRKSSSGTNPIPIPGPIVDYTDRTMYTYPPLIYSEVPSADVYPPLKPLGQLMADWNHDEDIPEGTMIHETLLHFNYSNPQERALAQKFRNAEVPFKVYDIPEIDAATRKWTDDYVDAGFKDTEAQGHAQESPNNYFAFFIGDKWVVNQQGLPPVRSNDWDFAKFATHARYADAVRLSPDLPHFYWQSGVPREQRFEQDESHWGFISRDLPSFSSKTDNFFVFHVERQKGIQCRFGERGVIAATHYDSGMNFVGMITGAKRYILQPPRECSKLGLFTSSSSPIFRHSLLNFAHMQYLDDYPNSGMSEKERAWLEKAAQAQSVETVLKQGEALYIPSHWFHYIVSLQKSAQCNVRSGVNVEGHPVFGNQRTVQECRDY